MQSAKKLEDHLQNLQMGFVQSQNHHIGFTILLNFDGLVKLDGGFCHLLQQMMDLPDFFEILKWSALQQMKMLS
jgi:hypothetical protein